MKNNVIVILCDQLRSDFLSCYNKNSPVSTPNIDKLAEKGTLFQHAVTASPVCAPGRASMMTGRYVSDHQVWTNDVPFREGMEYLPQRMADLGYACGSFGKLHHYPKKETKGFHEAWQMEENRLGEEDDYLKYLKELHPEVTDVWNINQDSKFKFTSDEYYESQIALRSIQFMEKHRNKQAFFTWISFQGPHTPMDPPDVEYDTTEIPPPIEPDFTPPCEVANYRKSRNNTLNAKEIERYRLDYGKMLEFIDGKVGEILLYLEKHGLADNTTILFSADHGSLCGDYNMREKGPYLYQAQLEVPMIVSNHPDLPKNSTSTMLTSNLDIASTALELAGDSRPLGYSRGIATMYLNENYQYEKIYSEFCDSVKIISTKELRFSYYPFTGEMELVKIADERVNLSDDPKYQGIVQTFLKDIIDYMVISKGVHIEAHDLTPKVQQGLEKKLPHYQDEIPLVFPISTQKQINRLKEDGLDSNYNEFCKEKQLYRYYGKYWDESDTTAH